MAKKKNTMLLIAAAGGAAFLIWRDTKRDKAISGAIVEDVIGGAPGAVTDAANFVFGSVSDFLGRFNPEAPTPPAADAGGKSDFWGI